MLVSKILYPGLYLKLSYLLVILLTNKGEYDSHTSVINCLIPVAWTCVGVSIANQ